MTAVGVAWYVEPEWASVKNAAVDPEVFESSFKEWAAMAEDAFANLRRAGVSPQKVLVASGELLAWCLAHGKENIAASRAEFVYEQMRKRYKGDA